MRRFVGQSLEEFEFFFLPRHDLSLDNADYPPRAHARSGPLGLRLVRDGALLVEVRPCLVETDDFRLKMLFAIGSHPFADAYDLACFWNTEVASAFGLPPGPLPVRPDEPLISADIRGARCDVEAASNGSKLSTRHSLPSPNALATRLARSVCGQENALSSLSALVVSQLAKRTPCRPATVLLLGPSGVGKTATLEALPGALAAEGWPGAETYRIDCNQFTHAADATRFLGASPGFVGYTPEPPLVAALRKPQPIVILDEIDKAHAAVQEALYALLDSGQIMTPDGQVIRAPGALISLTSACEPDALAARLHRVPVHDRAAVELAARAHLREHGWASELLGRIDTIAIYYPLGARARREAAVGAIQSLAGEYGFRLEGIEPVLVDVILDLSADSALGARGLYYAARRLLGEPFGSAAAESFDSRVTVRAGPPPYLIPVAD